MNKSLKYIVLATSVLSTLVIHAQIKNQKTETVKIYGNCGMCENTIEKAGNMKNQAIVDWNKETKMATISYDSLKTSKDEILKRIALAGYDSDMFLAPYETFASLPSCCQYDRPEQTASKMDESNMEMATKDLPMHTSTITKTQETKPLSAIFDNYFALKNALVETDGASASTSAKALSIAIDQVEMKKLSMDVHMAWMKVLNNVKEDAEHIANTKEISNQRDLFNTLSKNLYEVMKIADQETPTYYQFCPMANDGKGANWLSKEETIKNPYYGSQMLSCGKVVETIE